jgi:hypothetical protein
VERLPRELHTKSSEKIGIYLDKNLESAGSIPARDKRGMLASKKKRKGKRCNMHLCSYRSKSILHGSPYQHLNRLMKRGNTCVCLCLQGGQGSDLRLAILSTDLGIHGIPTHQTRV